VASGISSLPFSTFALLMLPIHLAIGVVEGIATAALVLFVRRARPDLLRDPAPAQLEPVRSPKPLVATLAIAALATGGVLSWFASTQPDGLEWSVARASGIGEVAAPDGALHRALGEAQRSLAVLPDYGFPGSGEDASKPEEAWPAVDAGTSVAGIVGGVATLVFVAVVGTLLRLRRRGGSG
jgi:cobalt/nickel transport system permease protein